MERTIIAYLKVDDNRAFQEIGDGPIAYLVKEFAQLEQRGILLQDAAIADADAAGPKEAYLVYLAKYAFDNLGSYHVYPMSYKQWRFAYTGG
ncbi:MAG: hypothetical protein ACLUGH_12545 [Oscillospiraceae bacterium]|jgi:hypothetical protein